jgi:hypothetical protein
MSQKPQTVIVDNCAVDRLAEFGVNPVADFENTEFRLMYTPDLKLEYKRALSASARTSQKARTLIEQILKTGNLIGFFGFGEGPCLGFDQGVWIGKDQLDMIASVNVQVNARGLPRKRTDAHLVALARDAIVITANAKESHWTRSPIGSGLVIQWNDLKNALPQRPNLAVALRHLIAVRGSALVPSGHP